MKNAFKKIFAYLLLVAFSTSSFATVTNGQVFAYAEANYTSLFSGASISGQYEKYNYRYYASTGNYLAVDTSDVIYVLGPVSNGQIQSVGPISAFEGAITAWEVNQGSSSNTNSAGSNSASTSITALQLSSRLATGNIWTYTDTNTDGSTSTSTKKVVSYSAGVATMSNENGSSTYTLHFDESGALIYSSNVGASEMMFPASASVGTTWTQRSYGTGYSDVTVELIALNVNRTVPAGTFTDCAQVQYDFTYTNPATGEVTNFKNTDYISSTVGRHVETVWLSNGAVVGSRKLLPGYVANATGSK